MERRGKPTGISYEDAADAAQHDGSVNFEGRKARVIGFHTSAAVGAPHSVRLELDLGEEYVVLFGYFSGSEFIEESRESPFQGPA
jgi:hypothetical protein